MLLTYRDWFIIIEYPFFVMRLPLNFGKCYFADYLGWFLLMLLHVLETSFPYMQDFVRLQTGDSS